MKAGKNIVESVYKGCFCWQSVAGAVCVKTLRRVSECAWRKVVEKITWSFNLQIFNIIHGNLIQVFPKNADK